MAFYTSESLETRQLRNQSKKVTEEKGAGVLMLLKCQLHSKTETSRWSVLVPRLRDLTDG